MKALVYLVHAAPEALPLYVEALRRAGIDADVVLVNRIVPNKLSSAYRELAEELRRGGRVLPGLRARFPSPRSWDTYDVRFLVTYSAGYGLAAPILARPDDVAELDGYVAIDSYHAGLDPDGSASDVQLAPLVAFAIAAREGKRVCVVGHSDVQTPQTGPGRYASTTQVARELYKLAGGTGGGFLIEAHDETKDQRQEHRLALVGWGPDLVARAIVSFGRRAEPEPEQEPTGDLGLDALAWATREHELGHAEVPPGSNGGEWVERYFAPCVRLDRELGLKSGFWCAAAACASAFSIAAGRRVPHHYRASVQELWTDACSVEFGSARSAKLVRAGGYTPRKGDLCILTRGGPAIESVTPAGAFAKTKGKGHVGRVKVDPDADGYFWTKDGNAGAGWGDALRNLRDPELVGFISYAGDYREPSDAEVEQLARLVRLAEHIDAGGPEGWDAIDAASRA
jgi:hypothetical protein